MTTEVLVFSRAKSPKGRYLSNIVRDEYDPYGEAVSVAAKSAEAAFQWSKVRLMLGKAVETDDRALKLKKAFYQAQGFHNAKFLGGKTSFRKFKLTNVFNDAKWKGRFDDHFSQSDLDQVTMDILEFMCPTERFHVVRRYGEKARRILEHAEVECSTRALVMAIIVVCRMEFDAAFCDIIFEYKKKVKYAHRGGRIDPFWGQNRMYGLNVYGRILGVLYSLYESELM